MAYCIADDILHYLEYEELARVSNDRDFIATSTLAIPISSSDSSLTLTDASQFLDSGRVLIDQEEIDYTSKTANVLNSLTRGVNYTEACSHSSLSKVSEVLVVDSSNITYCIRDAQAEIESYLGTRYSTLPLSDIPISIRKTATDLSIYNLYTRRKSIPPQWQVRYQQHIEFLKNVQKGIVVLQSTDTPVPLIKTTANMKDLTFSIGSPTEKTVGSLDGY
jgi:phage gp36-like protein